MSKYLGGSGHWTVTVYCTGIIRIKKFCHFYKSNWLVQLSSIHTFQLIFFTCRKSVIVYLYLEGWTFYRPLSYPSQIYKTLLWIYHSRFQTLHKQTKIKTYIIKLQIKVFAKASFLKIFLYLMLLKNMYFLNNLLYLTVNYTGTQSFITSVSNLQRLWVLNF